MSTFILHLLEVIEAGIPQVIRIFFCPERDIIYINHSVAGD
jgi:hypothetical protein